MGMFERFGEKRESRDRDQSRHLSNKGLYTCQDGRLDEGIALLKQAIELDPNNAVAHVNLGFAYLEKGWTDQAITAYKRAIELDPNNAGAHLLLGRAYLEKGWLDQAIAENKRAIELDPNNAVAHVNLGFAYSRKGWTDQAITELERAIELDPNDATAHNNLGLAYYDKGWLDQAITEFKQAIELDPDHAKAHFNLAVSYYSSGRFDLAWKHVRTAHMRSMPIQDLVQLIAQLRKVSPAPPGMPEGEDPFSEKVIVKLEEEDGLTINWRYGYRLANRYEVRRVCSGGQAVVYIVEDLMEKGNRYAAKSLKEYFRKPKTEKQWKSWKRSVNDFLEECNVWVELGKHRHIVQAEYLEKIEGVPLVMSEFIDGGGLDDWLKKSRLDMATALDFAIQACIGMEYANKKGVVVHRDIKPGNILVTRDGVAKVNDFGLARAIESAETIRPEVERYAALDSASLNLSRGMGTPPYMAPEQFPECLLKHQQCDVVPLGIEADIYAFGLVLYEMITGKCVVKIVSDREMEIQREAIQIASHEFTLPNGKRIYFDQGYVYCFLKGLKVNPPFPSRDKRLNAVILKCLEKAPSRRYHSFRELREELMQIYHEETGRDFQVIEEPPYEPNWRNMGKTYWVLGREKGSVECYDKALEQNPADTLAWLEKGLASAEVGDLGEFGLCMEIIPYLKPRRKNEVQRFKREILNESYIRLRDIRFFDRLAFEYAVPERVRDWISRKVQQEFTDPFRELSPVILERLKELKDNDKDVRWRAAEALGRLGDRSAVPALIEALKDEDFEDSMVGYKAAEALARLGDRSAVPALIETLKHKYYWVRKRAAEALGRLGDRSAVPALIEALKDEDFWVQEKAAEALGRLGDRSAVPALIEALKHEKYSMRWRAAEALGRLGDRSAVQSLIEALKDEKSSVRSNAAEALARLGDRSAVPALIETLKHKDSSVRWDAAEALGRLGDRSAVQSLIEALKDEDSMVGYKAAEALARLGDRSAVPALIEALKHKDSSVRWDAAEALGRLGDRSAVPALIEALKDEKSWVRWSAAEILGRLGDRSAVPALIEALKDEEDFSNKRLLDLRWNAPLFNFPIAAEALGRLADKQSIPRLLEALTSFPESKKAYVVVALRWVCSQPDKAKLSHTKDKLKAYSALN